MKTSALTLGGILVGISVILLYYITLIPSNTLALLTLLSFIPPIALMQKGLKTALLVYICTSISSLFFMPLHITLLYLIFFGIYGIFKGFIERLNKSFLELIFKLLFFNTIFLLGNLLLKELLGIDITHSIMLLLTQFITFPTKTTANLLLSILIAQPIFLIYDYALTLLVGHYDNFIKKYLKHSKIS